MIVLQGPWYRFLVGLVAALVPLGNSLFGWHLVAANVVAAVVAVIALALIVADVVDGKAGPGQALSTLGPDLEAAVAAVLKAVAPVMQAQTAQPAADTGAMTQKATTGATALDAPTAAK